MDRKPKGKRERSSRLQQKRERARHEILQVARDTLRDGGVEAVTLASVAGVLGMTKQALYHYFPSKEALTRSLVTSFIDEEVETLVATIEAKDPGLNTLGTLIRAFYDHYIDNLDVFRAVYCQSQLYSEAKLGMDSTTIRDEINPGMQRLFDAIEVRLMAHYKLRKSRRKQVRRLAVSAWTSALGLVTMLGVAEAINDPLLHDDKDLLDSLARVFDEAVMRLDS